MNSKASKVRAWLGQLADRTIRHWISYGSMSQQREGRLLSVAQHKQGLLLVLDTGTAIWRCRQQFAKTVLRCLSRRREMRAKMTRLHLYSSEAITIDGATRMTFATVGGDVERLFATPDDVAEYTDHSDSSRRRNNIKRAVRACVNRAWCLRSA